MVLHLPRGRISTTCVISMLRYETKNGNIFLYFLKIIQHVKIYFLTIKMSQTSVDKWVQHHTKHLHSDNLFCHQHTLWCDTKHVNLNQNLVILNGGGMSQVLCPTPNLVSLVELPCDQPDYITRCCVIQAPPNDDLKGIASHSKVSTKGWLLPWGYAGNTTPCLLTFMWLTFKGSKHFLFKEL